MLDDEVLVLTNDEDKRCARCNKYYPTTHFYRKEMSPDGMQSWCIECQRDYQRKRNAYLAIQRSRFMNDFRLLTLFRMLTNAPKETKREAVALMEKVIKSLK